jgi:hypothetical protein
LKKYIQNKGPSILKKVYENHYSECSDYKALHFGIQHIFKTKGKIKIKIMVEGPVFHLWTFNSNFGIYIVGIFEIGVEFQYKKNFSKPVT